MRIIAGKYKRTPLMTLEGNNTRPTKDMVKEALFSSIDVQNSIFLDLFSGSGAIGIEALSRGAKKVIFNDNNRDAIKIIRNNLNKINEEGLVYNYDYDRCLDVLNDHFDYIFLDPPYAFERYDDIFTKVNSKHLLASDGRMIVEVFKDVKLKDVYDDLILYKEKKYGITKLLYYRNKED